jgi:hypothetical protein
MTVQEIVALAANAILNDGGVQSWCEATFGQGLCVFIGIDEHNPPDRTYWPLAAIIDATELKSDNQKYQQFGLVLGSAVVNDTVTTVGSLHTYAGMLQAEELRGRVESALFAANIGHQVECSGDSSAVSSHPYYISYSAVTISLLKSSRHAVR